MSEHGRFHLKDISGLRSAISERGLDFPVAEEVSILAQELSIGGKKVSNRFLAQPMEGFDAVADGGPGELTFRRYRRYARGGFGSIWIEATSVVNEGRSNPGQLCITRENAGRFRELVAAIRQEARSTTGKDVFIIIQLTHSGRYSKPTGIPEPIIAHHSPVLDPKHHLPPDYPLVSDEYLDDLQGSYVSAAGMALDAGVDAVDVKSCHRYLVSELLASFEREGKYGGSFENRTRFLREVVSRISAGYPELIVTTRMSAYDAIDYPYGFGVSKESYKVPDLDEPIKLAKLLAEAGMPLLNISIGNPYFNPHFGRPFDFPIKGLGVPDEHPLIAIDRFIRITGEIQKAVPDIAVVASGYSWLRHLMPNVAAAVIGEKKGALLGIGRGAFAYPDSPNDIMSGKGMNPAKCCVACSACTQIMRDGAMTGCVVHDSEIYGPQYRAGRRYSPDRLKAEAQRCRDCETPTCVNGCPANVRVPDFIAAYLGGDIESAYDILREKNVLPEMCAYVCPVEVQCEGCCIEKIFTGSAVAIKDIQMGVCRLARQNGVVGVNMPENRSGRKIAVIGGGPAGIAATIKLLEAGHSVTLIEKESSLGGTPELIIPDMRLSTSMDEVSAILEPALKSGRLELKLHTQLGADLKMDDLVNSNDAVLLAIGLGRATSMDAGERAPGVYDALEFLRTAKKSGAGSLKGKRVAVVGGGNTAMDCAGTAVRMGAKDVYLVYRRSFQEMPAWPAERDEILKQGVHMMILSQPVGYELDESGSLKGMRIVRTELSDPDESGRRRPVPVEGTESVIKLDAVVEAIGQELDSISGKELSSLTLPGGAPLLKGKSMIAANAKIYCAGDLMSGGTTVVQSVREGMMAADAISAGLSGDIGN